MAVMLSVNDLHDTSALTSQLNPTMTFVMLVLLLEAGAVWLAKTKSLWKLFACIDIGLIAAWLGWRVAARAPMPPQAGQLLPAVTFLAGAALTYYLWEKVPAAQYRNKTRPGSIGRDHGTAKGFALELAKATRADVARIVITALAGYAAWYLTYTRAPWLPSVSLTHRYNASVLAGMISALLTWWLLGKYGKRRASKGTGGIGAAVRNRLKSNSSPAGSTSRSVDLDPVLVQMRKESLAQFHAANPGMLAGNNLFPSFVGMLKSLESFHDTEFLRMDLSGFAEGKLLLGHLGLEPITTP